MTTAQVKRETSLSQCSDSDDPAESKVKDFMVHLRTVARSTDLAKLRLGESVVLALLDKLVPLLQDADQHRSLEDIKRVEEKRRKPTRTIVAVAGGTGAAKSSLINTILSEEKLLPTSCIKGERCRTSCSLDFPGFISLTCTCLPACTSSVVTEISHNPDQTPDQLYRAEIEFMLKSELLSKLEIISDDIVTGDIDDPDSEAGVALAKLLALFPELKYDQQGAEQEQA